MILTLYCRVNQTGEGGGGRIYFWRGRWIFWRILPHFFHVDFAWLALSAQLNRPKRPPEGKKWSTLSLWAGSEKTKRNLYGRVRMEEMADVALQLCPPLQFGPLTYQPIECVFTSSNQSALWSCLRHLTSQVGEGCSMSFVRLMRWRLVYETVLERFPVGFLENFTGVRSMFIWARLQNTRPTKYLP